MTLDGLLQEIYLAPPQASTIETAASELNITANGLLDELARSVAEGYLSGKYPWDFGDVVMNNLFTCAYPMSDLGLPAYAWGVCIAFDEGEYIHREGPAELDGEPRTKALLESLADRRE